MSTASKKRNRVRPGIPAELTAPLRDELARCRADPSRFNDTVLCRSPYWRRQKEVCRSVVEFPVTCAVAGNGVGKSRVASGIVPWFAVMHPGCRVVIAAPTNAQLAGVLWGEVTGAFASAERAGFPLGGRREGLSIDFGDGWLIEGWGQGSVESKSGRHAPDLLAVVDEASGCKPSVLEAIDSLNPSRYLFLGNPLRPEGKFFEVASRAGDPNVNVITIPSLESPHIGLSRSPWGLADRTWLELMRAEYGEESLWWQSHVLARFPGELTQTLLPAAWLNEAALIVHKRAGPVRLGVDIGLGKGGGDDSSIVGRDDNGVLFEDASNRWTLEQLCARVSHWKREHGVRPEHITFDATGIGADLDNRLRAAGIAGAKGYMGSHSGGDRHANLRSACGWAVRRRLDAHRATRRSDAGDSRPGRPATLYAPQVPFHLPGHLLQRHRAELQGLRYRLDDAGRIQLEPKAEFVGRLKHSPNFLDALMMTFAFPHS